MSSSRATIIAGAMPPRVTATIAFHDPSPGPRPSRRQASARLSRWIWSQLMWKPFSWGSCVAIGISFKERESLRDKKAQAQPANDDGRHPCNRGLPGEIAKLDARMGEQAGDGGIDHGLQQDVIDGDQRHLGSRKAGRKDHQQDAGREDYGFRIAEV